MTAPELRALDYLDPVGVALRRAQLEEVIERYADLEAVAGADPEAHDHDDPVTFRPPVGDFVVVVDGGEAVGCGAFRPLQPGYHPAGDGSTLGVAEVKRMYVRPHARGRGLARLVLVELERRAIDAGYRWMWLETGTRQPEAMALYESHGYVLGASYGEYRGEPTSRCYAKRLTRR